MANAIAAAADADVDAFVRRYRAGDGDASSVDGETAGRSPGTMVIVAETPALGLGRGLGRCRTPSRSTSS